MSIEQIFTHVIKSISFTFIMFIYVVLGGKLENNKFYILAERGDVSVIIDRSSPTPCTQQEGLKGKNCNILENMMNAVWSIS